MGLAEGIPVLVMHTLSKRFVTGAETKNNPDKCSVEASLSFGISSKK